MGESLAYTHQRRGAPAGAPPRRAAPPEVCSRPLRAILHSRDKPRGNSMPVGGYCSVCDRWVWLTPYGECQNGHPASAVRDVQQLKPRTNPVVVADAQAPAARRRRRVPVLALPVGCEPDPAVADAAVSTNGHGVPSRFVPTVQDSPQRPRAHFGRRRTARRGACGRRAVDACTLETPPSTKESLHHMTDRTSSRIRLAVPSETPGGLDAARSGHFERSPSFTLIDLVNGEIAAVVFVENAPHGHGGCMSPVLTLGTNMVDAVIVAGIGHRPLLGCLQG